MTESLVLIDGSSYLYRAFYAVKDLSTRSGFPTNAVYGFMTMLNKLVKNFRPARFVMIFDTKEKTFRHGLLESYKESRAEMPEGLSVQIPYIKKLVDAYRIPMLESPGFEADDLMATLSSHADLHGWNTVIVSGDKDLLQCVSAQTRVYDPSSRRLIGLPEVEEEWGIPAPRIPDYLGLAGDAVDDIPGVPGIGDKTAVKLIRQFGSLEVLYERLPEVGIKHVREKLSTHRDIAFLSRNLATVRRDAPVSWSPEAWAYQEPDPELTRPLFRELEFHDSDSETPASGSAAPPPLSYSLVRSESELRTMVRDLQRSGRIAIRVTLSSEEPMAAAVADVALSSDTDRRFYIPLTGTSLETQVGLNEEEILHALSEFFTHESPVGITFEFKHLLILFRRHGMDMNHRALDLCIAGQLLHPDIPRIDLSRLSSLYLGTVVNGGVPSDPRSKSLHGRSLEDMAQASCGAADALLRLEPLLTRKIDENRLGTLYREMELPLIRVIAAMEFNGVMIDVPFLKRLSNDFGRRLEQLQHEIYDSAQTQFNIDSPKQLQDILFHRLKLKPGRKTKTGFSTDVDELERLASAHPLPQKLLEYRAQSKLKNTYIDALPTMVHPATGRIHATYHQDGTATGRLSSRNPNLQNIPIRTPEGRLIRKAFLPQAGYSFVSADYSQIELRVLAHLSADPKLIRAFHEGRDIHQETASEVFNVKYEEVSDEMRRRAKIINFGIIYGISVHGLSQQLSIDRATAQSCIESIFGKFPGLKGFLDRTLEDAREGGSVKTLFGRKRPVPDVRSKNPVVRSASERIAVNTPIQGTAADLMKMAMVRAYAALEKDSPRSRILIQVHDELLIETPDEEVLKASHILRRAMEEVYPLAVPLQVEVMAGKNWGEMN